MNLENKVDVSELAIIHPTVKIWPGTSVRENVVIGEGTVIGRGVYIGPGVKIGSNCKIQNEAQIYEPAIINNGVFIGPGVIITTEPIVNAIKQFKHLTSKSGYSDYLDNSIKDIRMMENISTQVSKFISK